jgi:hypothetical protein
MFKHLDFSKKKRFEVFSDYFTITCKKCNSTNVMIWDIGYCQDCGDGTLKITCNNCNHEFDYHKPKQIDVEYDKNGNEVKK